MAPKSKQNPAQLRLQRRQARLKAQKAAAAEAAARTRVSVKAREKVPSPTVGHKPGSRKTAAQQAAKFASHHQLALVAATTDVALLQELAAQAPGSRVDTAVKARLAELAKLDPAAVATVTPAPAPAVEAPPAAPAEPPGPVTVPAHPATTVKVAPPVVPAPEAEAAPAPAPAPSKP